MSVHSSRGRAWETTRKRVLERDGHVCQICLEAEATEVDHVVPRVLGGDDQDSNLIAACKRCNARKGARILQRITWLSPRWFGDVA